MMLLLAFTMYSCSDLEPEFTDVIPEDKYFQNDDAFISALGAAYTNLYGFMNHGNVFSLDVTSSDEAAVTHKGPDWEDGGQWLRMHRHEFFDGEGVLGNVWNFCYGGINTCNRLVATFETSGASNPNAGNFISELLVLRAYYYMILLDVFGNVPLLKTFDVPEGFLPATESRADVFAFVESEILSNMDNLPRSNDLATYGRMNYYVAQAMLSTLYLNAEVYTGTARWQDCVDACDRLIGDNAYTLEANIFNNFEINNGGSAENIFAIPYDGVNAGGFNLVQMTLHYESQKTFKTVEQPWNGYCVLADFYNSFEETDERFTGGDRGYGVMLHGPQYAADGETLLTDDADSWYEDNAFDGDARVVVFSPEINELAPNAFRDGGARLSKYEYEVGSVSSMSNDFAVYRYGEILLNKAEALHRMTPGDTEALDLVNMIRNRAKVAPFMTLDEDNLLAERGRELCFEAKRRADLIRFGKWNDAWWEKAADIGNTNKYLMPIPADQISLNSNLVQNPGY